MKEVSDSYTQMYIMSIRVFTREDTVLLPDDPKLEYRQRSPLEKKSIHWGQRKLGLSLIQYLTQYWNPEQVPNPVLVYVGAAPGNNIKFVMKEMFPQFRAVLYDSDKFDIQGDDHLILVKKYFTDKTAEIWAGREDVFFYSDIRNINIQEKGISDLADQRIIWNDMILQHNWIRIIKPVSACLKFRFPYPGEGVPDELQYFPGYIYFGIWAPQSSTETRLVVTRDSMSEDHLYNVKDYESQMFFFNVVVREQYKYQNPFGIGYPMNYDNRAEIQVWIDYIGEQNITEPLVMSWYNRLTAAIRS